MTREQHHKHLVKEALVTGSAFESALRQLAQEQHTQILNYDLQRLYLSLTLITDQLEELFPTD